MICIIVAVLSPLLFRTHSLSCVSVLKDEFQTFQIWQPNNGKTSLSKHTTIATTTAAPQATITTYNTNIQYEYQFFFLNKLWHLPESNRSFTSFVRELLFCVCVRFVVNAKSFNLRHDTTHERLELKIFGNGTSLRVAWWWCPKSTDW